MVTFNPNQWDRNNGETCPRASFRALINGFIKLRPSLGSRSSPKFQEEFEKLSGVRWSSIEAWTWGQSSVPEDIPDGTFFRLVWFALKHAEQPVGWLIELLGHLYPPADKGFDEKVLAYYLNRAYLSFSIVKEEKIQDRKSPDINKDAGRFIEPSEVVLPSLNEIEDLLNRLTPFFRRSHNLPDRWYGQDEFIKADAPFNDLFDWFRSKSLTHALVFGNAGIGKSTLVLEFAYSLIAESNVARPWDISAPNQVIWTSYRTEAHTFSRLLNIIIEQINAPQTISSDEQEKEKKLLDNISKSIGRNFLLIIDNLDAYNSEELKKIIEFMGKLPSNIRVLATSKIDVISLWTVKNKKKKQLITSTPLPYVITVQGLSNLEAVNFIRIKAQNLGLQFLKDYKETELLPLVHAAEGNLSILKFTMGYLSHRSKIALVEGGNAREVFQDITEKIFSGAKLREIILGHAFDFWQDNNPAVTAIWKILHFFVKPIPSIMLKKILENWPDSKFEENKVMAALNILVESNFVELPPPYQRPQGFYEAHSLVIDYGKSRFDGIDTALQEEVRKIWISEYYNFARKIVIPDEVAKADTSISDALEKLDELDEIHRDFWKSLMWDISYDELVNDWHNVRNGMEWLSSQKMEWAKRCFIDFVFILTHFMNQVEYTFDRVFFAKIAVKFAEKLAVELKTKGEIEESYKRQFQQAIFLLDSWGWKLLEINNVQARFVIRRSLEIFNELVKNQKVRSEYIDTAKQWQQFAIAFQTKVLWGQNPRKYDKIMKNLEEFDSFSDSNEMDFMKCHPVIQHRLKLYAGILYLNIAIDPPTGITEDGVDNFFGEAGNYLEAAKDAANNYKNSWEASNARFHLGLVYLNQYHKSKDKKKANDSDLEKAKKCFEKNKEFKLNTSFSVLNKLALAKILEYQKGDGKEIEKLRKEIEEARRDGKLLDLRNELAVLKD